MGLGKRFRKRKVTNDLQVEMAVALNISIYTKFIDLLT